jgi:hypothetical protein
MYTTSDLYRLAWALCNIMDGMQAHDIAGETGLPEDECKLINEIRNTAMVLVQDMQWKKPE